ncbi:hypothetical protein Tco_0817483 [Tanacetum coccineum]
MSRMVFPLISLNYLPASLDYFLTSPGNTSSLSENGLIPLAISSSHDDSYMHAIQAYDANNNEPLIPPQVPMVSPTTLPPSPVLSPMFDFFIPEEILPPRERSHFRSSSSTNPPAQPQAIEIGENYHGAPDTSYARHEEQIKDILNHLDELSLDHIEEMKDKIEEKANGTPLDVNNDLQLSGLKMPPKRTSTSSTPAMTQAAIRQLVADSVAAALEAQAANMANTDNTNRNPEPRETPAARKCTYKEFMSCQPFYFNVNCTETAKVKYATGTGSQLTEECLDLYCPRIEVRKIEDEFYNLVVKGNDLKTYARRFQELETLCPNIMLNNEKLMEVFIGGLPQSIEGTVTASKPQTLEESINIA